MPNAKNIKYHHCEIMLFLSDFSKNAHKFRVF